ncbi:MAG: homoserine kinase, partial [Solirubrobacterales bacterium]
MNRRRVVRVPASTANLGPGFDVLAGALSIHLTVDVVETGTFLVETDLPVPTDKDNLIVRAFETLHSADDFTFKVTSEIPLTGGLGSSASAILAGVAAADHIFELGT